MKGNGTKTETVRDKRLKSGLNQEQFWNRLGVTQSGGSRYEAGRRVPAPVQKLLDMATLPKDRALKLFQTLRAR